VDAAISCCEGWSEPQVENFITYLNKHKHRIVNYGYLQERAFPLALALLNQKLNKLLIVSKLLVQVGNLVMYRKSFVIAVLI
jgi:hypothetical protein